MTSLRDLQLRFQDYLIGRSNDIETDIVSTDDARSEHRLGAYYNAYRIRLIDSLAVDFPAMENILGKEAFEVIALGYLDHFPSSHPSVRWFGRHLPEYISRFYEGEDKEFLFELCDYEWKKTLVFDAAASSQLVHLEDIAQISPESWATITFSFKPAIQWLDLYWNIPVIEAAIEQSNKVPEKERSHHPLRWLLWRQQLITYWRSLDVHEAWAIEQAVNGACFGEICEGLLEWVDAEQIAITGAGFLKQWASDELLESVNFD